MDSVFICFCLIFIEVKIVIVCHIGMYSITKGVKNNFRINVNENKVNPLKKTVIMWHMTCIIFIHCFKTAHIEDVESASRPVPLAEAPLADVLLLDVPLLDVPLAEVPQPLDPEPMDPEVAEPVPEQESCSRMSNMSLDKELASLLFPSPRELVCTRNDRET